jgi:hypothetical protein
MHAVTRSYSGPGARELFDLIEARRADVEALLRGVTGFHSYMLFRTQDGGVTVTVCDDQSGTDESVRVAAAWIRENAGALSVSPPTVAQGPVLFELT